MKKVLPLLFTVLSVLYFSISSFSQATIVSTTGYIVNISLEPIAIVPSGNSCTWGYNYNVRMQYKISFSGPNAPGSLYTMQGTLGCGGTVQFFDLPNNGGNGTVLSQSNVWTSASTCNTATPASLSCTVMKVEIEGPGISARTVNVAMANIILGVNWENFSANLISNAVKLKWNTASESNNDYFSIERSANSTDWTAISRLNSAGNSANSQAYTSTDAAPLSGTSYYRIRQTDRDGKTTVSETKMVKNDASATRTIGVYPLPNAGNSITLTGISNFAGHHLTVLNAGGSKLYTTALSQASVELPSLKPGLYFIQVTDKVSGETSNIRYVKI